LFASFLLGAQQRRGRGKEVHHKNETLEDNEHWIGIVLLELLEGFFSLLVSLSS